MHGGVGVYVASASLGPLAKEVSDNKGNGPIRRAAEAGLLNDDGTAKSGKKEEDLGGIERWFGVCHAWVAASIRHPEPQHGVDLKLPDGTGFTKLVLMAE